MRSLVAKEPDLLHEHIIVVDDGARTAESESRLPGITWVCGEKPFIFARNANIGIKAANCDVVLSNDDATLETERGYTSLSKVGAPYGLTAAAISGEVGNPRQRFLEGGSLRFERGVLCFICIFIPKSTWKALGPLDERFTAYGWEDNDYCRRALIAGMKLAIYDGCIVEHGRLPSTLREGKDFHSQMMEGGAIFEQKWSSLVRKTHTR